MGPVFREHTDTDHSSEDPVELCRVGSSKEEEPDMAPSNITQRDPSQLKPWPGNARTHSKKQIKQIARSIETFGFTNPVLIDAEDNILAGHGRMVAAQSIGMRSVPCMLIEYMSDEQKRAYVIADNKLALNAGWDEEILAIELQALIDIPDLSFDIGVIGFEPSEIDILIDGQSPEDRSAPDEDDKLPPLDKGALVSRTGDLWICGDHRIYCGDSLNASTYEALMGEDRAQMVFTDPPYNVPVKGHVSGLGRTKHDEFAMASGEMSRAEFAWFLMSIFKHLNHYSSNGSIHFVCMDWRHMTEILVAGEEQYTELKNLIVWAKDNGGMGSFYRSRHELIFAFKNGTAPHINNFELGQSGRYRTNVWE